MLALPPPFGSTTRTRLRSFPGSEVKPPAIDYKALAKKLRLDGKSIQAALVKYMADKEEADAEDIAEKVHGDEEASHQAMWNNAKRTSDSLANGFYALVPVRFERFTARLARSEEK